ncbi:magnesium/cobalt transporter CorA [Trichlorobacter ammonificans]|uniref:Magnesium transport protein CorA n=1 Tax=Trichlorobacter ammonificans TaxID=2916410 RepID=A0ABN8HFV1_9BACT|nr:magnesium/cobalt transporter CorA [Trichlorobacter ammonificans]CAH2031725.1 Magnesium transport protein CorA [Trichlorobacter ammonificans]
MIRVFYNTNGVISSHLINSDEIDLIEANNLIWVDMLSPSMAEISDMDRKLGLDLPSRQETEEIEFSARYWEDEYGITINTYFLAKQDTTTTNETVSFTLKDNFVVTIRFVELPVFGDFIRKLTLNPSHFTSGAWVMGGILEMRIEDDADTLEAVSREIATIARLNPGNFDDTKKFLSFIANFEATNITIRENLTDKQRVLSSLLKTGKIPGALKSDFSIMIKDVNSLITTANFNFERLDYLQNLFLNFLSIEQNKVIKIFTVMSVIFLPPTLIASIYGMNFRHLPELELSYGYPLALCMIVVSAVLPLYIFKKKGWL